MTCLGELVAYLCAHPRLDVAAAAGLAAITFASVAQRRYPQRDDLVEFEQLRRARRATTPEDWQP